MRWLILAVLLVALLGGCTSKSPNSPQADGDAAYVPAEQLPESWALAPKAGAFRSTFNAYSMEENPDDADPGAFSTQSGLVPDWAHGAIYRKVGLTDRMVVAMHYGFSDEAAAEAYRADTDLCAKVTDERVFLWDATSIAQVVGFVMDGSEDPDLAPFVAWAKADIMEERGLQDHCAEG